MNVVYQTPVEYARKFPTVANTVHQIVVETARNVTQYLHVTGAIGNNRIDTHVVSYKRFASLCNPGQKITLWLDSSFPGTVEPGNLVTIYERGVKVFTGYVTRAVRNRPSYEWSIDIDDTYTRVTNFFISEQMDYDTPQSAQFLMRTILDQTGIEYVLYGADAVVPPGTSIGLRSAHDALSDLLVYGSWYAWVNPDGVLNIKRNIKGNMSVVREPISVEHENSTAQTRNVVKIYGRIMEDGSAVNVSLTKDVPGTIVDLVTVVANPLISNYDDAERIGNYILSELGSQTNIINFSIEGDPSLQIGSSGSLFYSDPVTNLVTSGSGPITSIESRVDKSGYTMDVTIGERCPRISGWSPDPRELRAIWIAARAPAPDPRPEKLIYTLDFGAGGQPTYTILSDIPSGQIVGMHVTRNGRRVYLLMHTVVPYGNGRSAIWYTDNPYSKEQQWVRLVGTGDDIGYPVDQDYFGISAITSMRMIGNTLWFSVRRIRRSGVYDHVIGSVENQSTTASYTLPTPSAGLFNFMGDGYVYAIQPSQTSATIQFRRRVSPIESVLWSIPNILTFALGLNNGVEMVRGNGTGNWWSNDLDPYTIIYSDESAGSIRRNGYIVTSIPSKLNANAIRIRGDYWGGQYQFVDLDGWLHVGYLMGGTSKVFQWATSRGGAAICLDKTNSRKMAWIPAVAAQNNEIARYSDNGGSSWNQMTGNWWGTNSDVVAKRAMQSAGAFSLIDAHPTFWTSEAPAFDGL